MFEIIKKQSEETISRICEKEFAKRFKAIEKFNEYDVVN